jgi:hypothetical protein
VAASSNIKVGPVFYLSLKRFSNQILSSDQNVAVEIHKNGPNAIL